MTYLIVGVIITLISVGLMMSKNTLIDIIGMLLLIVGLYFGLKGRRELDKFKGGKGS